LEINEHEAEITRLIYTLYIEPDSSITKITRKLRNLGYKTKTGRPWETDRVNDILRDETYAGTWYANKHVSIKGEKQGLKPREEWIEVKVPEIVTKEVFEKAQQLLDARKNWSRRNVKYKYLLRGMVKCGDCGNTIAGTADKQTPDINGRKYGPYYKFYYRCTHFLKNQFEKLVKCRLKYIQADRLDSVVWNEIEKILEKPELIRKAVEEKEKVSKECRQALQQQFDLIVRQQAALSKQEERIIGAYRQSIISIEQLKTQMGNLKQEAEKLESAKQELVEKLQCADTEQEIKEAIDYVASIRKGIEKFSFEVKREVLRIFNTCIKVSINGIVDIFCTLPKISSSSENSPDIFSCFASVRPIYLL
ncbi:MAG: recombinase family protein, partial [Candidatus Diapherotrites archaeon]|nr:recombinase family protein [Candidatus Diapherotrites archaeon]